MRGGSHRASWPIVLLVACLGIAGCGHSGGGPVTSYGGGQYAPPGPREDPWGPYIREASARFRVPDRWIREVMRQESGGHEYLNGAPVVSEAGAIGLMQVEPYTYAGLKDRYGLGDDPYDPRNSILAGTAYIREMYDKYGAPAFLAAYNAGPARLDDYLAGTNSLPNETVNYLASIAPRLGDELPMTGPLAAYATPDQPEAPVRFASVNAAVPPPTVQTIRRPDGCFYDPDAAYDPTAPCRAAPASAVLPPAIPYGAVAAAPPAAVAEATPRAAPCMQDPDAAYDPDAPCRPAAASPRPVVTAASAADASWGTAGPQPPRPTAFASAPVLLRRAYAEEPAHLLPARPAAAVPSRRTADGWAVQVGAFVNPEQAEHAADRARSMAVGLLQPATVTVASTVWSGGRLLYRARLVGLSAGAADAACSRLSDQGWQCLTVPPGG